MMSIFSFDSSFSFDFYTIRKGSVKSYKEDIVE